MNRKPLITRLRAARTLLREWRNAVKRDGITDSTETEHELARFDAALAALKEAIAAAHQKGER